MKKKKTSLDLMREIRTTWSINPRTRVHDNDIRKSKKKMRSEGRKETKKALGDDPKSFFILEILPQQPGNITYCMHRDN